MSGTAPEGGWRATSGADGHDPLGDVREGETPPPRPSRSAAGRQAARLAVRAVAWVTPHGVLGWTLLLGLLVVGVLTGLSAQVYESVVEEDGVATLDRPVLRAAVAIRDPTLTTVVSAYTDLGDVVGLTALTVLVGLAMALAWRRWTPVVLLAVTGAGSALLTVVGKGVVGRDRPPADLAVVPLVDSPAFPSGHTLNTTAIAGVVAYLLVRRLRRGWAQVLAVTAAAAFAGVMGLTRVYLGQHWLTDVLAAYCLGLAWAACVVTAHRLYLTAARARRAARDARPPGLRGRAGGAGAG